jgi:uncharacterized protein YhbP (UPF0306 family)
MDKKIEAYILTNKVFTLATAINDNPYCAHCFYVYDAENKLLLFLSDNATQHIKGALQNNKVAGSIFNGETTIVKIQGIQFVGEFIAPDKSQGKRFYQLYYDKNPFAKAKPSPIWAIQLNWIKMTDNTLGFGKKLIWERDKL